jgi:hypothetical protein
MPLPAAHVAAVARLGCPRHDCREDAEAGLIGDGEAAIPAVRWALMTTRDAEVRARCGAILAVLLERPHAVGESRPRRHGPLGRTRMASLAVLVLACFVSFVLGRTMARHEWEKIVGTYKDVIGIKDETIAAQECSIAVQGDTIKRLRVLNGLSRDAADKADAQYWTLNTLLGGPDRDETDAEPPLIFPGR